MKQHLGRQSGVEKVEVSLIDGKVDVTPKEDGQIDLSGDTEMNYKKIRAYDEWPGAYFFTERSGKKMRVRITDAEYTNNELKITRVVPEGKKEMSYEDFLRGGK